LNEDEFLYYPLNEKGKGRKYQCANKTFIRDKGSRNIFGHVKGRAKISAWNFRVTKVHRALMSVSQMVDKGYRVVFDADNGVDISYFVNKDTGSKIPIPRSGKTYEIEMEVIPFQEAKEAQRTGFRPGWGLSTSELAAVHP